MQTRPNTDKHGQTRTVTDAGLFGPCLSVLKGKAGDRRFLRQPKNRWTSKVEGVRWPPRRTFHPQYFTHPSCAFCAFLRRSSASVLSGNDFCESAPVSVFFRVFRGQ